MLEKNLLSPSTRKEETAWNIIAAAIGLILFFYVWMGYTAYYFRINNDPRQVAISRLSVNVLLTILSWVLSYRISPGLLQFVKMGKQTAKVFGLGVLAYPLLLIISILLHRLVWGPLYFIVEFEPASRSFFHISREDTETVFLFFLARITGPLWEELIFRGMIQGALRMLLNENLALLVSSLAFGFLHYQGLVPWISFLISGVGGGLIMGLAYQKSKTLMVPMGLHVMYQILSTWLHMAT